MKRFKQLTKVLVLVLALSCVTSTVPILPTSISAKAATIKLNKQEIVINKGRTTTLKLKGTKADIIWKSNKPSVAKVNGDGLVTAKKPGTARITAKVKGSSKKYTCAITVENPHFEHSAIEIPLNYGTDLRLKGTSQKVKWSSSNRNVVTVSAYGVVRGKSVGTATITAKVNGDKFRCTVTVVAPDNNENNDNDNNQESEETEPPQTEPPQTEPSQPEFSVSTTTLDMNKSGSVDITYTGEGKISCEFSISGICSYSWGDWHNHTITLKITGTKSGTTILTIFNSEDDRKLQVTINVDLYSQAVNISSSAETIYIGASVELDATVSPDYAQQSVEWSTNDESVATVSYGRVNGISEGQAIITATCKDGKASAQCVVTVENPIKLTLPNLPVEVPYYGTDGSVITSCIVKNIYCESHKSGKEYYYQIYIEGEKTEDNLGGTIQCGIRYRLLKNGITVDSGTFFSPNIRVGESFSGKYVNGFLDEPGNYQIELTDALTSSKPNPPDTNDPTSPDVPSGLEGRELLMAAYGVNAAYNGSKFPSTLRLNRVTCQHNVTTGYGDNVSRMVLRCYAQNSLGGYGEIYVVVIACESNEHYANATYEPRVSAYIRATIYSSDPGMENGTVFSNKKAVDAYNQYLGDTYGRKNIPYD